MHLYVIARGMVDKLNRWENDLLSKKFPYCIGHAHPETGKTDQMAWYQLGVRPIRTYEITFPEPCMKDVLGMINPQKSWNKGYDKYIWSMQKALRLDKIPEFDPIMNEKLANPSLLLDKNWIECAGIGMKKDKYENGIELI
jgi:hypothetical protein